MPGSPLSSPTLKDTLASTWIVVPLWLVSYFELFVIVTSLPVFVMGGWQAFKSGRDVSASR
jgi:hypothetical protein